MGVRIFTLEEARSSLPLVERIARDAVGAFEEWELLRRRWGDSTNAGDQQEIEDAIYELQSHINGLAAEMEQVGAVCKCLDLGLVDWYGDLDGKIVYWCWRVGEADIEHYHDLETGYPGRCPIPAQQSIHASGGS